MTIYRMMPLLVFLFSCEGAQFKGNSKPDAPEKSTKKSTAATKSITATTPSTQNVTAETSSPMTEDLPALETPSVVPVVPMAPVVPVVAAPPSPAQTMVAPEAPYNLVFGGMDEGAYRLADSHFDSSSQCYGRQLASGSVSGTILEFHFQLTKTTTVNFVKFSELCGLDEAVNRTFTDSVVQFKGYSGNVVNVHPHVALYKKDNAAGINFGPVQALPPGNYMLEVRAGYWSPIPGVDQGVFDDFVVGRIDIQADAPMKRLGIITRGKSGQMIQQRP